jgi:hypothetical protein
VPVRQPGLEGHDGIYVIQTRELALTIRLWSVDSIEGDDFVLVQISGRNKRPSDEQVAGVLRCIRACDAFVEAQHEVEMFEKFPHLRSFLAKAYPTSPASWGSFGEPEEFLRVQSSDDPAPPPSAFADVNNHLPARLPPGWSDRAVRPQEGMRLLATPHVDLNVCLQRAENSDAYQLRVAVVPRPRNALVSDAIVRETLAPFRARGVFQEYSMGHCPDAPGMRLFGANAR